MQTNFDCSQSKQSLSNKSTGGSRHSKGKQEQFPEDLFFWIPGTSYFSSSLGRKCTDWLVGNQLWLSAPQAYKHFPPLFHYERYRDLIQRSSDVSGENCFAFSISHPRLPQNPSTGSGTACGAWPWASRQGKISGSGVCLGSCRPASCTSVSVAWPSLPGTGRATRCMVPLCGSVAAGQTPTMCPLYSDPSCGCASSTPGNPTCLWTGEQSLEVWPNQ